jgi:sugar/nucleoside kinase (ribokinase family)
LQPLLQEIDYFLPNEDEALRLTGKDDPWQMLAQLLDWGVGMVLLTQGKKGVIAGQAGQWWQSGIFHMDMLDPSGSGDAFTAGIITGVLEGFDIPRMLRFASALGASAVRALGTTDGVFNRQEAEQFILTHPLDILQGRL